MASPQTPSHRLLWLLPLTLLGLVFLHTHLRFNLHPTSAPPGIYLLSDRPPTRGALVTLCLPETLARLGRARGYLTAGPCPGGVRPVGKRLVALPGDRVEVRGATVSVNGSPLPGIRRRPRDSAGRFIPSVPEGTYRVAPGTAWLISEFHPRSWDSRYYGPVPLPEDTPVLMPLIFFPHEEPR